MAKQAPSGRWHRFRLIFRRCRITALLLVLVVCAALLYLDTVGLPDFIKKPLIEKLHARGIDLRFSRLRWQPFRGIIADNVFFGGTNATPTPELTLKEVQVGLDYSALFNKQFQVDSLNLRQGRLSWPIGESNQPPRELSVDNIQSDLQLRTNDVWVLDNLQAQFAGANIQLSGAITNASAIRDWKFLQSQQPPQPNALQNRLRLVADTIERIHFSTPPDLKLDIRGDARSVENFKVRLTLQASNADTPWGMLSNAFYSVVLAPPSSNQSSRAEVKLRAAVASTGTNSVTNLFATLHLFSAEGSTNRVLADLDLSAASVCLGSNRAERVHLTGQWLHSLTNVVPLSGHCTVQAADVFIGPGSAKKLQVAATLNPSTNHLTPDETWAWWSKLAPYPVDLEGTVTEVHWPKFDADEIHFAGQWNAPELNVQKLSAKLYGGKLDAGARLNVATRDVTFNAATDFDGRKIGPLLTAQARRWLAQYSWDKPPRVKATGSLVLPASVWTNHSPDWRGETRPTLRLAGEVHATDCAFRGVPFRSADSHFSYTNLCWLLPDLVATRPEGVLNLVNLSNDGTRDYYFRFHSTIDPKVVRPLFATNQQRGFDLVSLSQPPVIDGEVWGRWLNYDAIHGHARVAATNFAVRDESVDKFHADVEYTNRTITLINPWMQRAGTQELAAATVKIVFDDRRIYVTNGTSTADPAVVAHAVGPQAERAIEDYHFLRPPAGRVEGAIPMRDERDADLHFEVEGGPFEWWKFRVPRISGKIDWVGEHLALRDVQTDFYLGKASGNADFQFTKGSRGADFKFNLVATDANLHWLATDLMDGATNNLEGFLTSRIEITNANTGDWQKWQGAGRVTLRDGLIWDIPIFGLFSPVLNTFVPGLGDSRAREGSATFNITNGVIDSRDLEIQTLMARLRYWGTIDLEGNVNARMEAEPLRNAWVVGPVLSVALWPVSKTFEYRISGTIHKPKSDPMFIPRVFFFPLHPVQTIKDMIPEDTNSVPTNAPLAAPSTRH